MGKPHLIVKVFPTGIRAAMANNASHPLEHRHIGSRGAGLCKTGNSAHE
jgi:hypothetical protein